MKETILEEVVGAKVIHFDRYSDDRGFFQEVHSSVRYDANLPHALQTNLSNSSADVVRGMHVVPFAKLCTCVRGKLWDVVADVRHGSPTYGNWFGIWLTEDNCTQLYVPAGCAHGFFSAYNDTLLLYCQDGTYNPDVEWEVNWRDPTLNIEWPEPMEEYLLSEKDKNARFLEEVFRT